MGEERRSRIRSSSSIEVLELGVEGDLSMEENL